MIFIFDTYKNKMSAPMRIFRRIRPLLAYSPGYTFRSNLKRFITVGVIQSPVAIKLSCESKVKIEVNVNLYHFRTIYEFGY